MTSFGLVDSSGRDVSEKCAPDGHLLRVTIPDAVLIQFDLLRMNKIFLETYRGL